MTKKEFAEIVAEEYNNNFKVKVKVVEVTKNNDQKRIAWKEEREKLQKTVYVEEYYEKYMKESVDKEINEIEDVVEKLREILKEEYPEIDEDFSYRNCCQRIYPAIVNKEKNKELIKTAVYREYGDLIEIFKINIDMGNGTKGSVTITESILRMWKEELGYDIFNSFDLHLKATSNMMRDDSITLDPMESILSELLTQIGKEDIEVPSVPNTMYILTNENRYNGAAAILAIDRVNMLLEEEGIDPEKITLIPSSIHEWIVLTVEPDYNMLSEMIQEVNERQLKETDILSDHPYKWNEIEGLQMYEE